MRKRDSTLLSLGLNVRRKREALDLTQEALAEKANLDQTYISGIERGVRNPGIKNVARIAKALGVTTAELCKGVGARTGGTTNPLRYASSRRRIV
jgi:transcriptional regulator with XRE-family HTH domain